MRTRTSHAISHQEGQRTTIFTTGKTAACYALPLDRSAQEKTRPEQRKAHLEDRTKIAQVYDITEEKTIDASISFSLKPTRLQSIHGGHHLPSLF
jgi:hypothetical protein